MKSMTRTLRILLALIFALSYSSAAALAEDSQACPESGDRRRVCPRPVPGKPVMSDDLFITALDPENLCRGAESLAAGLGKYPTGGKLLINRIEYEPELYPHLATEPAAISRELWQKIWQNRGAEDEPFHG